MTILELAAENRSTRRFRESVRMSRYILVDIVEATRLAHSGANLQLLRFTPVWEENLCDAIFPHLNWAGYLKDWAGPEKGQRPAAYVILQLPHAQRVHTPVDAGIAAAYMVLRARESGYASCMIMSFEKEPVSRIVGSPEGYGPYLVIAFGVPAEEVVLEGTAGGIEYYRDEKGVHHVPKRGMQDILTR